MRASKIRPFVLALLLLSVMGDDAAAQASLAGKTVTVYVGFGAGGGYDL
jgi:tripartite-type tricarboxylate transporter receptor subunit TctC